MYCPECGTKNPDENSFCSACNAALIDNSPQPAFQQAPPVPPAQGGFNPVQNNAFPGVAGSTASVAPQQGNKANEPAISIDFNAAAEKLKNFDAKKTASNIGTKVKGVNKTAKIIVAAVAGVIVAVIAFACIGSSLYNPEKVAERYFESYIEGDYYDMFNYMMVEESEFVTDDNFYNYMVETYGYRSEELIDYEIREGSSGYYGDYYDYEYSSESSRYNKTYSINYIVKGSSHSSDFVVTLALADSKKLLFFDEYKVIADQYVVKNYTIYTAPGSKISLDGIELEKSTDVFNDSDYYDNFDAYVIDQIFGNEHELTIENDLFLTYTNDIYIESNSSGVFADLDVSSETTNALVMKCKDVFNAFVNAAKAKQAFPADAVNFTEDYSMLNYIKESYDDLCDNFATSSTSGYVSISATDFQFYDFEYDDGIFAIETKVYYDYVYRSYSYWSSESSDNQSSSYDYMTLSLKNVDGEWEILSVDIDV